MWEPELSALWDLLVRAVPVVQGFGLVLLGWQQWGLGFRGLVGVVVSQSPPRRMLPQLTSDQGCFPNFSRIWDVKLSQHLPAAASAVLSFISSPSPQNCGM